MRADRFWNGLAAGAAIGFILGAALFAQAALAQWFGPAAPVEENGFYSGNEFNTLWNCQQSYVSGVYDTVWMLGEATQSPRLEFVQTGIQRVAALLPPEDAAQWEALNQSRSTLLKALGLTHAVSFEEVRENLEDAQLEEKDRLTTALWVAQAVAAQAEILAAVGSFFLPRGVTNAQLTDVVKKYIELHPEERHLSAAWLVWKATAEAFRGTR